MFGRPLIVDLYAQRFLTRRQFFLWEKRCHRYKTVFFIFKCHRCIFTSFAFAVVRFHATGFPIFSAFSFVFFHPPIVSWIFFIYFVSITVNLHLCANDCTYKCITMYYSSLTTTKTLFFFLRICDEFPFDFHDVLSSVRVYRIIHATLLALFLSQALLTIYVLKNK